MPLRPLLRRTAVFLAVLAVLALGADSRAQQSRTAIYPGAEWERWDRPESAGWSAAGLERVREKLASLPSTGLLAVAGGRVVLEYGDVQAVSYLASVRKSVLAMLFGNYVASGKLRLDKTLAEAGLDDLGGLTAEEKQATIRDLLMARSGIYHPASNAGDDTASAPPRGSQKHGAYYLYNNWDFNALGTLFEKETGRDIYDALESDLARPLAMQDFDRSIHKKSGDLSRSMHPAYHMNLSTRDMARIGYLMLREGQWAGRQLVPRDWVREIKKAQTPVPEMNPPRRRDGPWGYGYLWWVWDGPRATGPYAGAYAGHGAIGQHIVVLPALDLVVAHKTRPGQGRSVSHEQFQEVLDLIVKAYAPGSATTAAAAGRAHVGRSFLFDYGELVIEVRYLSERRLAWEQIKGPQRGLKGEEEYGLAAVRPNVCFVWWQEKDTSIVTQVVDFEKGVVHTTWTSPEKKLLAFQGRITPKD